RSPQPRSAQYLRQPVRRDGPVDADRRRARGDDDEPCHGRRSNQALTRAGRACSVRTQPEHAMATIHNYFFAVLPDAAARDRIGGILRRLPRHWPGLPRALRPARLHVSLASAGWDEAPMDDWAARAVRAMATVRRPPFVVAFDRLA